MCILNGPITETMVRSRTTGLHPGAHGFSSPACNVCRCNWVPLEGDVGWLACSLKWLICKCSALWGPFKTGIRRWCMLFPFVKYMAHIKLYLVPPMLSCMQIFLVSRIASFVLEWICKAHKVLKNSFCIHEKKKKATAGLNLPRRLIRDLVKKEPRKEWTPEF